MSEKSDWEQGYDQAMMRTYDQRIGARKRIAELEAEQRDLREYIDELEAEKECEMRVFKDGNAWCFVLPDFQDLQVSSSVWMKEGVLDKIYKELRSVRNENNP